MSDLIDRNKAIKLIDAAAENWNIAEPYHEGMRAGYRNAARIILGMPSAPNKKKSGTWVGINKIEYFGGIIEPTAFECSICGNRINNKFMAKLGRCVFKYCSTCGAEMRNEEDELHDTALDDHPGDVV